MKRVETSAYPVQIWIAGDHANAARERLWLSPHCMGVAPDLFNTLGAAA